MGLVAQEDEDMSSDADPCVQVMDKKTDKKFKKARELQKKGQKDEATEIYLDILEENPNYLDVNYYYALGYYLPMQLDHFSNINKKNAQRALEAYDRMYEICPFFKIQHNLYAARLAYFIEDFTRAMKFARVIIENPDQIKKEEDLDEAALIIKRAQFFEHALSHPVPFNPHPVEGISTKYDEYLAALSPDGTYFYFTRRQPYKDANSPFATETEDREFFSCSKKNEQGVFGVGKPLPYPFNLSTNEGSPSINLNNDYIVFARMTPFKTENTSYPNFDLYYSEWIDGEWTEPRSLGDNINRPDTWESQPSLSSDGKMLFFASDRPGGYGMSDIWYSTRGKDGKWQKPVNAGPRINTPKNERSPFLHTDSKTLYFSSTGLDGFGGYDIFYARHDPDKGWLAPVNIGYPINSENDEVDFFVSLDGQTAYFSSNNIDKKDWNIYSFSLYEDARPADMMIIKGKIENEDNDYQNIVIEIRDTASRILSSTTANELTGQYAIATELKNDETRTPPLILNVKKEGHAFDTQLINPTKNKDNVLQTTAVVKKVEVGKTYDLHDIHFGTNLYSLTPASEAIIDLFVEFLRDNPTVKVEIQGHTDDVGDDRANQRLSEQRAESVYRYVLNSGIDANRLRYKGYGETAPIAPNNTEAGRAKNRRTIFLIYDK